MIATYTKCSRCAGEGKYTSNVLGQLTNVDPCENCSGTGYIANGKIDDSVETILNQLKDQIQALYDQYVTPPQ